MLHLLDGNHKRSDTDIVTVSPLELSCPIIYRVEFSDFKAGSNFGKQSLDFIPGSKHLEVLLRYSHFSVCAWEEQVNSFWLISVICIVSNGSPLFVRNISSDGGTPKGPIHIFRLPYVVCAVGFQGLSKVDVRLQLLFVWLSVNAPACVPGVRTLQVLDSESCVTWNMMKSLSQVL